MVFGENFVDHEIFPWCAEIKRSHWMPSQGCAAVDLSIRHFGRSKRSWFKWNSHYMNSFIEETDYNLLQLSLDLSCFRRPTWWTVVLFRAHTHRSTCGDLINVFWSSAIVFYQNFYATIDKSLFWAIARFSENKRFLRPGVQAVSNVCWWQKCPRMALSYGMSHDNLALSAHARHQCSLAQRPF